MLKDIYQKIASAVADIYDRYFDKTMVFILIFGAIFTVNHYIAKKEQIVLAIIESCEGTVIAEKQQFSTNSLPIVKYVCKPKDGNSN